MTKMQDNRTGNRRAVKVVQGTPTSDGAGVSLTRVIGSTELDMLDPFLMLDAFESDDPDDYIAGFPSHPHRGFETVTYILAGKMRHKDSTGREGVIEAGGVQWMTAGRGIVHSEMPEQTDGLLHGFQLWVNLPASQKMTAPLYREFSGDEIPTETRSEGVQIHVVAGETVEGTRGAVSDVVTDPLFLDIELPRQAGFSEPLPETHNAFVYVVSGEISVIADDRSADTRIGSQALAVLDSGENVRLVTGEQDARVLLVAGKPIDEPVARYGPFVMNTRAELIQAAEDYQSGRFLSEA
jgi:redox-sensitive bicupin YhaK (pirin superfamily)